MSFTLRHIQVRSKWLNRCRRLMSRCLFGRTLKMKNDVPLISFTFDDFPRSALLTGGDILKRYGIAGTYYASLGLMDRDTPTGRAFSQVDLAKLLDDGHELGCHTFNHSHAWDTNARRFEKAILENREMLTSICPTARFRTLSYPVSFPHPHVKKIAARHFACCRAGGQTINLRSVDLNSLRAHFLEQSRHDPQKAKALIDRNRRERGWLIFATHDVCDTPSRFGCDPVFFENIVRHAHASEARILTIAQAFDVVTDVRILRNANDHGA